MKTKSKSSKPKLRLLARPAPIVAAIRPTIYRDKFSAALAVGTQCLIAPDNKSCVIVEGYGPKDVDGLGILYGYLIECCGTRYFSYAGNLIAEDDQTGSSHLRLVVTR